MTPTNTWIFALASAASLAFFGFIAYLGIRVLWKVGR